MPLTDEEAAQLAALTAKAAEPADGDAAPVVEAAGDVAGEVGAAVAEAVADVAQTVAAVVADEVGEAHQAAAAVVLEQAAEDVAEAQAEAAEATALADVALAVVTELADEAPATEAPAEHVEDVPELVEAGEDVTPGADYVPESAPAHTHAWFRPRRVNPFRKF